MKTDRELQRRVLEELRWEPSVDAAHIGVIVRDGIVTLTGHVTSYAERYAAEQAAKRVSGVRAVANELDVKLTGESRRTDEDIAADVVNALTSDTRVPADRIKVAVSEGWLRLEGEVKWQYQKEAAADAVRNVRGITGISNLITVKPRVSPVEVKSRIEEALQRGAARDARHVQVEVQDDKVILRGAVRSWAEKAAAEWVAWAAPGVAQVENLIGIASSRRQPLWVRVAFLVALLAMLGVVLAWPGLLFDNWMNSWPEPAPPPRPGIYEDAPVLLPADLEMKAAPGDALEP